MTATNHDDVRRLLERGAAEEAKGALNSILMALPGDATSHHLLGIANYCLHDIPAAIAAYHQAIAMRPDYAEAYSNLGIALNEQGRHDDAVAAYQQAIVLKPDYAEAYSNLAVSLNNLNRNTEAAAASRHSITLKPGYAAGYYNLGLALNALNRHQDAVEAFRQSLGLAPAHAESYYNLGLALSCLNLFEQAVAAYEKALVIKPDNMAAKWNRCLAFLALGQFRPGWTDYEIRWQLPGKHLLQETSLPCWMGQENLSGKKLLVQCEQGYGDAIQMLRFVSLLVDRGADCWIQAPKSLQKLIVRSFPQAHTPDADDANCLQAMDYRVPIMSLPLALGIFSETAIPSVLSYLKADSSRTAFWRGKLSGTHRKTVGLVWRGSPDHSNDKNRSATLLDLLHLIEAHPSIRFVTLQKNLTVVESSVLVALENVHVLDAELVDFDETASVIGGLDLVISIDSAPAHLSGALGKPTWILLPFSADWRWQADRIDTPWYPMLRLYRQKTVGDWSGVVAAIASSLAEIG